MKVPIRSGGGKDGALVRGKMNNLAVYVSLVSA